MSFARGVAFVFRWLLVGCLLTSITAQATSTITYYHNDLTGSPLVATDASGHVLWRESYRPFGERLVNSAAAKGNDVWFTSRRQDVETGLVYMGARYYDPVAGRFVSIDPKRFSEASILSFNRYSYANDNPYKFTDPDGRFSQIIAGAGALLLIGGTAIYIAGNPEQKARMQQSMNQIADKLRWLVFSEDAAKHDEGGAKELDKPKGVPDNWTERPTEDPNGRQWVNPENEGDRVRVMPGNPDSPYPNSRGPYVRDVRNGNQWLDTEGNRVEGRNGKYNNDTHIPLADYVFRP
jgi:RHS repeat-associated protein